MSYALDQSHGGHSLNTSFANTSLVRPAGSATTHDTSLEDMASLVDFVSHLVMAIAAETLIMG